MLLICKDDLKSMRLSRKLSTQQHRSKKNAENESNSTIGLYIGAVGIFVFGVSYASVPLYKAFCQMTGFGGTTQRANESKATKVKPVDGAGAIKVYFTASTHSAMPWKFIPTQKEVKVIPGETALAFYTVKNNSDHAITGVATYNVYPPKAGLYFSKIQCFCFEEQRLEAKEEIDMPVFFFIDPEILKDPSMENVKNITLSYTFFKTGEETASEQVTIPSTDKKASSSISH
jgi:cytochrome c oxidase assembly protein subunit 11